MFVAGVLPHKLLHKITQITDKLPYNEYKHVHQVNKDILSIINDCGIKRVLSTYFKCKPELLGASIFVTKPEKALADT